MGVVGHVEFLDVFVISVHPSLHFCTNFKRTHTHTGCYLPWNSNNPRAHKVGSIRGEGARFLRTNSHEKYFALASESLRLSLIRLHYPKHTWDCLPLSWTERDCYLVTKPRQCTGVSIHALRMPYFASALFFPSYPSGWRVKSGRFYLRPSSSSLTVL